MQNGRRGWSMFLFLQNEKVNEKKESTVRQGAPREENRTDIPVQMKGRMTDSAGLPLGDVRVHYNTDRMANVQHPVHELRYAVQKKQGTGHAGSLQMDMEKGSIVQKMENNVVQKSDRSKLGPAPNPLQEEEEEEPMEPIPVPEDEEQKGEKKFHFELPRKRVSFDIENGSTKNIKSLNEQNTSQQDSSGGTTGLKPSGKKKYRRAPKQGGQRKPPRKPMRLKSKQAPQSGSNEKKEEESNSMILFPPLESSDEELNITTLFPPSESSDEEPNITIWFSSSESSDEELKSKGKPSPPVKKSDNLTQPPHKQAPPPEPDRNPNKIRFIKSNSMGHIQARHMGESGKNKGSLFPKGWTQNDVKEAALEVVNNPVNKWKRSDQFRWVIDPRSQKPHKEYYSEVEGECSKDSRIRIKVIVNSRNKHIVTVYPMKKQTERKPKKK